MNTPSPDPKRPIMMIRFRTGQESPELWARTLPVIQANKACFDEVWFSTGVGVVSLEDHRKRSGQMAAAAADLRKIGVIPSLQIQATLGHSDAITEAAGVEAMNWGGYVGKNGEQCKYINCPRQPGFLEYEREICRIYAQWHPGSVWIDDDLRPFNHHPAMVHGCCYCKDCLALFAKEEGKLYTREELVAACEKDPALDRRWNEFGVRSLCGVAQVIAETFHQCSPETRLALQHGTGAWRNEIFRTLQKYSGHRSASRPGGGAYSDHYPYGILNKGIVCAVQKFRQPGYDVLDQVCPEIESCPRCFTCKTSQGHRLESLFYLAMGMDSLSYFIMAPGMETPEWYGENLLAPLAAETPAYREFLRFNEGTEPGGIGTLNCCDTEELGVPLIGTAFAGASSRSSCTLITKSSVQKSSLEELKECLKGNIIVNGLAVKELENLGLGEYIGNIHAELKNSAAAKEIYVEHPLCKGLEGLQYPSFGDESYVLRYTESSAIQVLTRYKNKNNQDFGAGILLFTRPDGTRAAIVGSGFDIHYLPTSRVTMLNRIADWVSHKTLPALTDRPRQLVLVPRIAADNALRSVTVVNPTIGPQHDVTLILRNVPETVTNARWIIPASAPVELSVTRDGDKAKVTIPALAAWEIGFAEF